MYQTKFHKIDVLTYKSKNNDYWGRTIKISFLYEKLNILKFYCVSSFWKTGVDKEALRYESST